MKSFNQYIPFSLFLIFLPFLFCGFAGNPAPNWMEGSWEGTGYQLNSRTTWAIHLEADPINQHFQIDYPSLSCGGGWALVEADGYKAVFKEVLEYGQLRCVNQGTIIITYVDENHISFTYFNPWTEALEAHSTLKRIFVPRS